jgi:hypothetical protein
MAPLSEACMGCGWTAKRTDFARISAIEVSNGAATRAMKAMGGEEGPFSAIPFWRARLNEGHRITGIGGSDNHDATLSPDTPSAVGMPTTVVEAANLSEVAILDGIRRGRVAIDLDGTRDRRLDLWADGSAGGAQMGGELAVRVDERLNFRVEVQGVSSGWIEVLEDGETISGPDDPSVTRGQGERSFTLVADDARHWVRINVRDPDGRLILIGNPIYLKPTT